MTASRPATASTAAAGFETIPDALRHWARTGPARPAASLGNDELDYADLDGLVREVGQRLRGAGVTPGDRLALFAPNSLEWVAAFLAGLRIGAIVVPLNIRLSPLEIRRQLAVCEPRAILATDALLPLVGRADPGETPVLVLDFDSTHPRSLWRLPAAGGEEPSVPPTAPALISFTSGTTGLPKGAVIRHGALVRSAAAFVPRLETSSADSTLVVVPLFHNTGFVDQLAQMILVGGTLDLLPEFHTDAAIDALARRPASYLIAVPSIFRLLMLHDRAAEAFCGCRVAVYGGASMPAGWIRDLAAGFPDVRLFNCYGLTEFTSVSHLLDPEDALVRSESVGRPVDGVGQRIVADGGRVAPQGEVGEIWLSGPMRMAGYWRAEVATRQVMRGDWLRTGDLGTLEDGFLTVLGRSADVINRGGEKIYATSVEAALTRLATIAEAAVVGAPHAILQERVLAWVVPRETGGFDEEGVRRELAEYVPDYAVPETFVVADELPRNAAGKVDRAQLRAEAATLFPAGGTR